MPNYKLGKLPARRDNRNLKMRAILREITPPPSYDFDATHPGIPTPMFANDHLGDCVIAGRAHQTLRFEDIEQKKIIAITDDDVTKEYFSESGGKDSGLCLLDSLKTWRNNGWTAGGQLLKILAFAEIDRANQNEVMSTMASKIGIMTGVVLPVGAMEAFGQGKPWTDTSSNRYEGGHCIFIVAYDQDWLTCVTWGRKQKMSWDWFFKYCDEAYGVIDAQNTGAVLPNKLDDYFKWLKNAEQSIITRFISWINSRLNLSI
jgi:hypothetical protein